MTPTNGLWFLAKVRDRDFDLGLHKDEYKTLREWAVSEGLVTAARVMGEPPLTLTEKGEKLLET